MSFIVIVCSKCKWARGVKAASKRVKCTYCGATIDVQMARPFASADNEMDLARAVGEVNENLHKHGKKTVEVRPGPAKEQPRPKFRGEREFIIDLAQKKKEFTVDDVLQALSESRGIAVQAVDREKVMKAVNDLLMKGYMIETKYCHYRLA
jgi:threonine synthase